MSTYLEVDRVKYLSSDNQWHPLCWLYFCRYCAKLRSLDALSHEVDSRFCPHCLDLVGNEMVKNRCRICYDCPSCGHTLSTRASNFSVAAPSLDESTDAGSRTPAGSKKVYYLSCGFCRWSSRDVGIPDQTVANGAWPERENIHERRICDLLAYYRQMVAAEKAEKDRRKSRKRGTSKLLQDKYGLTSVVAKRRAGLTSALTSLNIRGSPEQAKSLELKPVEISRAEAKSEVEPLPPDIYTLPLNLSQVCTLEQRLAVPEVQPISRSQLQPLQKHLQVKRSLRCRECVHNVLKPEYNAASIKFKICYSAMHHVPEVRVRAPPAFRADGSSEVIVTITNPVERPVPCSLIPLDLPEDENPATSIVALPHGEFLLSARDEAGEYDVASTASTSPSPAAPDFSEIVFRKANKVGVAVQVTPTRAAVERGGRVLASFALKYEYRNFTAVALKSEQGKEPEIMDIELPVMLDLGLLNESYA